VIWPPKPAAEALPSDLKDEKKLASSSAGLSAGEDELPF
jgi:hypothetical protein